MTISAILSWTCNAHVVCLHGIIPGQKNNENSCYLLRLILFEIANDTTAWLPYNTLATLPSTQLTLLIVKHANCCASWQTDLPDIVGSCTKVSLPSCTTWYGRQFQFQSSMTTLHSNLPCSQHWLSAVHCITNHFLILYTCAHSIWFLDQRPWSLVWVSRLVHTRNHALTRKHGWYSVFQSPYFQD